MLPTHLALTGVDQFKKLAYRHYSLYHWTISHLPNASGEVGMHMPWCAFERARRQVPAYSRFLDEQGYVEGRHGSLPLALAFVHLDGFRLGLQAQPNAIELHHGRNITDRLTVCELSQRLNLIDALVDGA